MTKNTIIKAIRILLITGFFITALSFTGSAQTAKKQIDTAGVKTAKTMLKAHVCTQACHDSGKHVYAHGEKGHVCTAACEKKVSMKMKEHVCTDMCKDGKHVYAHGEKGHVCDKDCKG